MIGEKKMNSYNENSLITVQNLTKRYGRFCAVDNISLTIKKGEIVGFLGLNGAGKSTTMDMLTSCLEPTSGTIEIGGYDVFKNPVEAKKMIGYLPDVPPLYDNLTILEYLKFVCDLKGVKDLKKEVSRVVDETGLGEKQKKLISSLSKGYRQRVGLAQALVGDPTVLILDEPTSGLDPSQVVAVRNLFKNLSKNHTIILSTHILSEVENICNRVLIINKGRIIANDVRQNLAINSSSKLYSLRVCCKNLNDIEIAMKAASDDFKIKNLIQISNDFVEFDLEVPAPVKEESEIYLNVSKALIAHDVSVLQFKNISQSIEKIFLELVEADNANSVKTGEKTDVKLNKLRS